MSALAPADVDRLVKLLGMLGSSFDGERAAAGQKAHEFIRSRGLIWSDIIRPSLPPPRPEPAYHPAASWRQTVAWCLSDDTLLSEWEFRFLLSIRHRSRLTPKQRAVLDKIAAKLSGDEP